MSLLRPPDPSKERALNHVFCLNHVRSRPGGGYITKEASRKLWASVMSYLEEATGETRSIDEIIQLALDRLPSRRVDAEVLESYRLVARRVQFPRPPVDADIGNFVGPSKVHPAGVTGYSYLYSKLLGERIVDGEVQVLVAWEPTWEFVGNVDKADLKSYHDQKRSKRRLMRQRAQVEPSTPLEETIEVSAALEDDQATQVSVLGGKRKRRTRKRKNKKARIVDDSAPLLDDAE